MSNKEGNFKTQNTKFPYMDCHKFLDPHTLSVGHYLSKAPLEYTEPNIELFS